MDIMFEIVSRQKFSADFPVSHVFGRSGGSIGRAADCDWVLPDRGRLLSRKHALVSFHAGEFYLKDVSSNGIRLSMGMEKIQPGTPVKIEDGDGFVIGDYTIMAKLLATPFAYAGSPMAGDMLDPLEEADPIAALENEQLRTTKDRLGEFAGVLAAREQEALAPPAHGDPRAMPLPSLHIGHDPWNAGASLPIASSASTGPIRQPVPVGDLSDDGETALIPPEVAAFFQELGYAHPPASQKERERVLRLAAALTAAEMRKSRLAGELNLLILS